MDVDYFEENSAEAAQRQVVNDVDILFAPC